MRASDSKKIVHTLADTRGVKLDKSVAAKANRVTKGRLVYTVGN